MNHTVILKNHVKICLGTLLFLFSFSSIADNNIKKPKVYKRTDLKCFVSFLGGGETIYRLSAFDDDPQKLADSLPGRMVYSHVTLTNKKVYKVMECVKSKNKFKSKQARMLEKSIEQ
jgi:hypothetical protein